MKSFFNFIKSKSKKQKDRNTKSGEQYNGVVGQYEEQGLPVVVRFSKLLPSEDVIRKYPTFVVVSWKYDGSGNNGMPSEKINDKMIKLESALGDAMDSINDCVHAYNRTGNNLKEFNYYTTNLVDYMKLLNRKLSGHERYPIEIESYQDEEWKELKELISDFG